MVDQQPPFLVRALPDPSLRQLAERYKLEKLLNGKHERRYFDWLAGTHESTRKLLAYDPTSRQLQSIAKPALLQEDGFLGHLMSKGITDFTEERDKVSFLADAAIAILVTRYLESVPPQETDSAHGS